MAMERVAMRGRRFPILQVGDTVSIFKKRKVVGDKEFMEHFKACKHKVESISENFGHKFYMLSDRKEYIRKRYRGNDKLNSHLKGKRIIFFEGDGNRKNNSRASFI